MVPVKKCVFLNMQKLPVFFQSSSMNRISWLIPVGLSFTSDDESTCCRPCLFSYQCKQQAGCCTVSKLEVAKAACKLHDALGEWVHYCSLHCNALHHQHQPPAHGQDYLRGNSAQLQYLVHACQPSCACTRGATAWSNTTIQIEHLV